MEDLTGKILIAMPGLSESPFDRSVVFLCAHSSDGAMGLIVNKPAEDLSVAELLSQLEIKHSADLDAAPVHFGGPIEHARGFVLHSTEYGRSDTTLQVNDSFAMTATLDILEDMAAGQGPDRALLALGYAGWAPGQLEGELGRNGWLTGDASAEIIFDTEDALKWTAALQTLGVDALSLSAAAGHA